MRIMGVFPPTESPAAMEKAKPSRLTGTSWSDGSACISRYNQLVSLSGNQTTCVTPFFFISSRTVSGLSSASCAWVMMSLHGRVVKGDSADYRGRPGDVKSTSWHRAYIAPSGAPQSNIPLTVEDPERHAR